MKRKEIIEEIQQISHFLADKMPNEPEFKVSEMYFSQLADSISDLIAREQIKKAPVFSRVRIFAPILRPAYVVAAVVIIIAGIFAYYKFFNSGNEGVKEEMVDTKKTPTVTPKITPESTHEQKENNMTENKKENQVPFVKKDDGTQEKNEQKNFANDNKKETPVTNEQNKAEESVDYLTYITKKLDMTPEEMQKFMPVYNDYQKKLNENRDKIKTARQEMSTKVSNNGEEIKEDNESVEKTMNKIMDLQMEQAKINDAYYQKLKDALPIPKVAKLMEADTEWQQKHAKKATKK